jgi:hypothetical protein
MPKKFENMKILYLFTLIMLSSFVQSQSLKCSDFKIGTFTIKCTNYELPIISFDRSEKIQKESTDSQNEIEGLIEWKSDCSYQFIYTIARPEMIGKKVSVELERIEGRKAFCKSKFEEMPGLVLEFEMEKMK